jgi:putative endonuclease
MAPKTRHECYYVYILASHTGTLYIGVTNHIERRMFEHKQHLVNGFASKYKVDRLVYYERFADIRNAIAREKQLKGWRRAKKIALFEKVNPSWVDLSREWFVRHRFQPEEAPSVP